MRSVLTLIFALAFAAPAGAMTLHSPDVHDGATIPNDFVFKGFGCTGGNQTPRFSWNGVPAGTRSFALTVYDPDAPTTIGWVHWTVFDIPADSRSLGAELPKRAVQGLTDFGTPGYGGPCPPVGDRAHRYIFTLDALDTELPLGATTTYAAYKFMSRGHIVAEAKIIALYAR